MKEFSLIDISMQEFKEDFETKKALQPAKPWSDPDMTENKRLARIIRAEKSFWEFDKIYYPPDMYDGGYGKPCRMHRDAVNYCSTPGVDIILGPRKFGKTVTVKKWLTWALLTGRLTIAGVYAEILNPKATSILQDISELIRENPRIAYDFKPEFEQDNADQIRFRTTAKGTNPRWRTVAAFSEGRSVRGFARMFGRPQFLFCDDVETLESSLDGKIVEKRIRKLAEAFSSLQDGSSMVICGNDFDEKTALHQIKLWQDLKLMPDWAEAWRVHSYAAWDGKRSLWPDKYPAETEAVLKAILKPFDEADWQANFQQNPVPPEGFYFKRVNYSEYPELPKDAKGVVYCDPNLSLKSKGDTTAITPLLYSPKTGKYYAVWPRCKSYSDSNELLDDILEKRLTLPVYSIAMDGWVGQESTWFNFIRDYCKIKSTPFPRIEFKRYKIDYLSKNLQAAWESGLILFPEGFSTTDEGRRYLNQLFGFRGKKAKKQDDAPDSLIGAFEHIHERGMARKRKEGAAVMVTSISDFY